MLIAVQAPKEYTESLLEFQCQHVSKTNQRIPIMQGRQIQCKI